MTQRTLPCPTHVSGCNPGGSGGITQTDIGAAIAVAHFMIRKADAPRFVPSLSPQAQAGYTATLAKLIEEAR